MRVIIDSTKISLFAPGRVSEFGRIVVKFGKRGVSGGQASHFLPELSRRLPRFLLENGGEIRLIVVAQIEADLGDRLVGGGEQVLGFDEFAGLDDLRDTFLQDLIADQIEVAGRHEQFFGIKLYALRAAEVFFEDSQEVLEGGILGGKAARTVRFGFPPLRFDHGKKRAQQVPDDGEVWVGLLHFPGDDLADRDQSVEATARLQGYVGVVMVAGVELESGFGDEFAFESKHPHLAATVFGSGQHAVGLSPRDKTDEGRPDGSGSEIYEMLQMSLDADDQLLKIVVMRFVGSGGDLDHILFGDRVDLEWLVQSSLLEFGVILWFLGRRLHNFSQSLLKHFSIQALQFNNSPSECFQEFEIRTVQGEMP